MTDKTPIRIADIERARSAIATTIRSTPVNASASLTELTGVPVNLKLEFHQITGSFKLRGAANAVQNLTEAQRKVGVVAMSTGNHGRGLAYAAKVAGVRCVICMGNLVPQNKVDGIKALGAEVRTIGSSQDEAEGEVERLMKEEGMINIPPFDHRDIIAGQGTLGLELLEQVEDFDTVLIPVSGGGLFSGMALALKDRNPNVRVIGVSMERGAAMYESLQAGKPVLVDELATLADSLGGGVGLDNRWTFNMVRELADDFVLVNEVEIAEAIRHIYWEEHQIAEGSGAVSVAALLSGKFKPTGPTVCILSGCNLDMKLHHRIISGENVNLAEQGKENA